MGVKSRKTYNYRTAIYGIKKNQQWILFFVNEMVNGERGVESLSIAMMLIQKSTFDDEMDDFANLKMCTTMMILAP